VTVECLVGWNIVWQSGYMAKKGITPVTDGIRDGRKASCRMAELIFWQNNTANTVIIHELSSASNT